MLARARAVPTGTVAQRPAPEIIGTDLGGGSVRVPVREAVGGAPWTLLLFVKLDCIGCETLWPLVAQGSLSGGRRGEDSVAVVGMIAEIDPGRGEELASRLGTGTLVVGRGPWEAYGVLGPSFAVLVRGATGQVHWESVAWDGRQVAADTVRALADHEGRGAPGLQPGASGRPISGGGPQQ